MGQCGPTREEGVLQVADLDGALPKLINGLIR
jgi:hypothetical protein